MRVNYLFLMKRIATSIKSTKPKEKKKPENWKEVLDKIIEMRKESSAPVDTKAPGKLSEKEASKDIRNYQTLIALMLSPQTRDEVNAVAMDKLKEHGLTPKSISEMSESKLASLIKNVSFYNNKAKYIKKTTEILLEDYKGKVPDEMEDLLKLPGIGKKVANLALQECYGKVEGIAVDTHVHRISNRLGWVKSRRPEDTQKQLEEWLPKKWWRQVNVILVGFGQERCKAINPKCGDCLIVDLCPYGKTSKKKAKPKKRSHKEVDK